MNHFGANLEKFLGDMERIIVLEWYHLEKGRATPFPSSFKCFTCDNVIDNFNCNRWAEDKWCPQNTQYCLTVHHFTNHGRSLSVTKKCATREECHFVGCHHHRETSHTECISCCEGMICNVDVPTNHTNAVFAVLHARRTSGGSRQTISISLLVILIIVFRL
ncbi:PREDICTED: ly6/PLAUR domain-containing protein 6B [Thamnophis sirtalis]|uniref:Ly6/PLAUR domain-containing protein 6B n=1 Tax=Thamnophis sirtalis TaxID=35019 RepID=A0A6I9XWS0_9SAUR|nr:PREDICTED: ly6/PLAUR domain-containing protein 6B [Thamnophis sirtalis]